MDIKNNRFILNREDQVDLGLHGLGSWPFEHGGIFLKIIKEAVHINLTERPASMEQFREYGRLHTIELLAESELLPPEEA